MTGLRSKRRDLAAALLLALVAIAGYHAARVSHASHEASGVAAVGIAAGVGDAVEAPLPGRGDSGLHRGRLFGAAAVLVAVAGLGALAVVEARLLPPGRPVLGRRGHGASLRAPPPLLLTA